MIQSEQIYAPDFAKSNWLGPPLRDLRGRKFDEACTALMRQVELGYRPSLIVGIRTGGFVVAERMARAAKSSVPVLPLTSRRGTTATKSRLPWLRTILGVAPTPVLNMFRQLEHRFLTVPRAGQTRAQHIDQAEAAAIAAHVAGLPPPARILVVDDAVDSGVTLLTVLRALRGSCRAEIRSAAITQTLHNPIVRPDFVLVRGTICRFPWSLDAG